jgi:hypothetical protein
MMKVTKVRKTIVHIDHLLSLSYVLVSTVVGGAIDQST